MATRYPNCDLVFCNIGNIHVMRRSLDALRAVCNTPSTPNNIGRSFADDKVAAEVTQTWLMHVSKVISAAVTIVQVRGYLTAACLCCVPCRRRGATHHLQVAYCDPIAGWTLVRVHSTWMRRVCPPWYTAATGGTALHSCVLCLSCSWTRTCAVLGVTAWCYHHLAPWARRLTRTPLPRCYWHPQVLPHHRRL